MNNNDALVILNNFWERISEGGNLYKQVTGSERTAIYKAISHVENIDRIEKRQAIKEKANANT